MIQRFAVVIQNLYLDSLPGLTPLFRNENFTPNEEDGHLGSGAFKTIVGRNEYDMTYAVRVVRTEFLRMRPDARQQLRGLEGEPLLLRIVALSQLGESWGTLKLKLAAYDAGGRALGAELAGRMAALAVALQQRTIRKLLNKKDVHTWISRLTTNSCAAHKELSKIPERDRMFRYANETNDIEDVVLSMVDKVEATYERLRCANETNDIKDIVLSLVDKVEVMYERGGAREAAHTHAATHAGLTALLGRLRLGAPAVVGAPMKDAMELLTEAFTRDVAERIARALLLRYTHDVCNMSDSDIAGLDLPIPHKRILTKIRDETRETWAQRYGSRDWLAPRYT
jgi:hypothetical protein